MLPIPTRTHFLLVPNMEPYIEFIGALQNSGFWLVQVGAWRFLISGGRSYLGKAFGELLVRKSESQHGAAPRPILQEPFDVHWPQRPAFASSCGSKVPGPPKVPKVIAQYPKIESTSRIGSIILGILELQSTPK